MISDIRSGDGLIRETVSHWLNRGGRWSMALIQATNAIMSTALMLNVKSIALLTYIYNRVVKPIAQIWCMSLSLCYALSRSLASWSGETYSWRPVSKPSLLADYKLGTISPTYFFVYFVGFDSWLDSKMSYIICSYHMVALWYELLRFAVFYATLRVSVNNFVSSLGLVCLKAVVTRKHDLQILLFVTSTASNHFHIHDWISWNVLNMRLYKYHAVNIFPLTMHLTNPCNNVPECLIS